MSGKCLKRLITGRSLALYFLTTGLATEARKTERLL